MGRQRRQRAARRAARWHAAGWGRAISPIAAATAKCAAAAAALCHAERSSFECPTIVAAARGLRSRPAPDQSP